MKRRFSAPWALSPLTPRVHYINLAERTDRNARVRNEMRRVGIPRTAIIRVDAEKRECREQGCIASHLVALEVSMREDAPFHFVVEYHFEWTCKPEQLASVCLGKVFRRRSGRANAGGGRVIQAEVEDGVPGLRRARSVQMTIAYFVRQRYHATLAHHFREILKVLENQLDENGEHARDQLWQDRQQRDHWALVWPPLCRRRAE